MSYKAIKNVNENGGEEESIKQNEKIIEKENTNELNDINIQNENINKLEKDNEKEIDKINVANGNKMEIENINESNNNNEIHNFS